MAHPLPKPWTVDDFLEWEARQPERYEFVDGRIVAMVGGTYAHAVIKGNVFACLREALRGGSCRPLVEGPRVVTAAAALFPDVAVVCGPMAAAEDR
jgi:Uma2 family endonuclease